MSQNDLPTTVTTGPSISVSFLVERMCRESRSRPIENGFANLTPRRFCRYLTDDDSRLIASRIRKRNV